MVLILRDLLLLKSSEMRKNKVQDRNYFIWIAVAGVGGVEAEIMQAIDGFFFSFALQKEYAQV